MSAFPAYRPADTAPPIPAAFAVGFAHSQLRTAIADLKRGQTAWALSTLQTTLAMLEQALSPELRPAHMAEWDSPPSARVVAGGSKRAGRPCGNESATPVGEVL